MSTTGRLAVLLQGRQVGHLGSVSGKMQFTYLGDSASPRLSLSMPPHPGAVYQPRTARTLGHLVADTSTAYPPS